MNEFRDPDDEDALQDVVRSMLEAVVPERADELVRHWERYATRFRLADDVDAVGHVVMDAGAYVRVRFNHPTMRLFWLASFLLWEGYEAFHRYAESGETDTARFSELYDCFTATKAAQNVDEVPWPAGVPEVGDLVDHRSGDPGRVAGELAIFSVAWAILHEVRHLIHQQEGTGAGPEDGEARRAEELSCDQYATEFLLANIADYAGATGQDVDTLNMKRQTGIYVALFAMALISEGSWAESDTHPALQQRLERVVERIGAFGFHLVAGAIATSAFESLRLRFPDAPDPLRTREFGTAFEYDLDQAAVTTDIV